MKRAFIFILLLLLIFTVAKREEQPSFDKLADIICLEEGIE